MAEQVGSIPNELNSQENPGTGGCDKPAAKARRITTSPEITLADDSYGVRSTVGFTAG